MNLQPLGDRVVVKPLSEEDSKTPSGIYIPDTAKEKPQEGEVVAVGPGEPNDNGEKINYEFKEKLKSKSSETNSENEDDLLQIPAFLRRQAN